MTTAHPVSTLLRVAIPGRGHDAGAERRLAPGRIALVLAGGFATGLALPAGWLEAAGGLGIRAFNAIAAAQYAIYLSRENVNADGGAEFAVLVDDEPGAGALERFIGARAGWRLRDSSVPGWQVVIAPAGDPGALATLRDQPFVRAVLRNRGMWICH